MNADVSQIDEISAAHVAKLIPFEQLGRGKIYVRSLVNRSLTENLRGLSCSFIRDQPGNSALAISAAHNNGERSLATESRKRLRAARFR